MSKRKKELNYRTMWIHNPPTLSDEGMDPYSFAKYSEASISLHENELNKLKTVDKKIYNTTGFINLICNLFHYSVVSIAPYHASNDVWWFYATLLKD